jgi:hypothetical protein
MHTGSPVVNRIHQTAEAPYPFLEMLETRNASEFSFFHIMEYLHMLYWLSIPTIKTQHLISGQILEHLGF